MKQHSTRCSIHVGSVQKCSSQEVGGIDTVIVHGCRNAGDAGPQDISPVETEVARLRVLQQSGGHPSRRRKLPLKGVAIASPSSRGLSSLPPPAGLEGGWAFLDEKAVANALSVSAEELATFSTGWFLPSPEPQPEECGSAEVFGSGRTPSTCSWRCSQMTSARTSATRPGLRGLTPLRRLTGSTCGRSPVQRQLRPGTGLLRSGVGRWSMLVWVVRPGPQQPTSPSEPFSRN